MYLIVLLIVLIILTALVLGPVALFRANALAKSASRQRILLQRQLDQLSVQLTQMKLRLGTLETERSERGAIPQPAEHEAKAPAQGAADATHASQTAQDEDPKASEPKKEAQPTESITRTPSVDRPAELKPPPVNALQALRAVRQRVEASPSMNEPVSEAETPTTPDVEPIVPVAQGDAEPARKLSLEEMLAGKVFVWIGAIALVLTAAFLLKLGFDKEIITEPVRVIGAGVFGFILWSAGEWSRRRAELIGQVLCGAAVAVLYATVLAGHQLYELFGSGWAFGMMASITAGAIVLSLRHGPGVALLGMVGGFMLPPVLGDTFGGATAGMVLYLLALEIGILAVTRRRGWFGLSALTLLFTIIWSLGYVIFGHDADARLLTALLIVGTAAAYLVQVARVHRDPDADVRSKRWTLGLSIAAVSSAVLVVALLVPRGGFSSNELWMLGLVAAGTIVLARLDRRYLVLPFATMGLSLLVLLAGAVTLHAGDTLDIATPSLRTLITTTTAYGTLYLLGGYVCLWGSPHKRVFTLLSVIAGPAYYAVILVAGQVDYGVRELWWPYTLMLAGVYALGVVPLYRRRVAEHDWPIAAFALMSFGLLCAGILQAFDHPRVAVCLALVSAVAALIDLRLFIRPLLLAACVVSSLAAVLLVAPGPFMIDIEGTIVFNSLLVVYVLAAIGFGVTAWCAYRAKEVSIARNMTWLTVGTLGFMLVVLTRQALHPTHFAAERFDLYEWSAYACVLMLGALLGVLIATRLRLDAVGHASVCVAGIGAVIGFIGALVPGNPLLRPGIDLEGAPPLALGLIGLYMLPSGLMWLWSRRRAIDAQPALRSALRGMAITLLALFAGLQIRNAFHPGDLQAHLLGMFECATYAIVWLLLGLLIQGIALLNPQWPITRQAGRVVFGVGLATAIIGNVIVLNPLWNNGSVGTTPVFNGLWYLLAPTILTLALLARRYRAIDRPDRAKIAGFGAVAVGFLLVSLLVRQGFSSDGVLLLTSQPGSAERYAYSLAWVLFGAVLLVAGVFTRLNTLRYGSLAVLLVAVGKVFLIDTASLDNLYRVFSFFGLGVTLIALGYLYQRLVFGRPNPFKKGAAIS